jgi:3-phenylpropionate/trans-cinnamate dioxygenase ferredoxin subunit
MAAGLAFALLAAVPGVVDYFKSVPPGSRARTIARRHGLLNGGVTALYAFNLWWRTGPTSDTGSEWWVALGLSFLGVATLIYAGWLGGELVFRYRIGSEKIGVEGRPTVYGGSVRASPGSWVEVARDDELAPGQLKHVVVNGTWLAVARTTEGHHAIDGICSHEGGPLCDGSLVGTLVQCPWHGARFDVRTGAVAAGPAKEPLRAFRLRVEKGSVMVEAPEG